MSFKPHNKKPYIGGDGKKPFQKFKKGGKKNKFFQNAKGFGKKGSFGRGTEIEQQDYTYFMGILTAQQNVKGRSIEENCAMANNVMEQTKGKEIQLSSNQVVCKVLENVISFVEPEHLERFLDVFSEGLRPLCSDSFASHVLEKLLEVSFLRAIGNMQKDEGDSKPKKFKREVDETEYNITEEFSKEHRAKCSAFVLRICKFLLNNMEEFISDNVACYLLRSALLPLAGVHIPKTTYFKGKVVSNSEKYNGNLQNHRHGQFILDQTLFTVPAEWTETLLEFPKRLQLWPQFKEFPYSIKTSALLQVICIALNTVDKNALEEFGKKLLNNAFINVEIPKANKEETVEKEKNGDEDDEDSSEEKNGKQEEESEDDDDDKPSVFKSDCAIRLLQALIHVAPPKLLSSLYKKLFKDRMMSLVNDKFAFFAAARMINYVSDKTDFEAIFDEMCPHFEEILQNKKGSIISSLSATCLRLKTKQAALITALQKCLNCSPSQGEDRAKAFFTCLIKLKPFEDLEDDKRRGTGGVESLIVQDILQFNKPIFLVNSILEAPVKTLVEVFTSPSGSFIVDAFFSSPAIGEKSREKLIKRLEGFYLDLALDKIGSKVMDQFFISANEAQKVVIANELSEKQNKIKATVFGRIVYTNLKLDDFVSNKEQWKASWSSKKEEADDVEPMETNGDSQTEETQTPAKVKKNKNKKRQAS